MTQLAEQKGAHLSNFARIGEQDARGGNGASRPPAWLGALRKAGIARFDEVGFPSGRDEHWRHTNFAPIARTAFRLAPEVAGDAIADDAAAYGFGGEAAAELVFVNGRYAAKLSTPGRLPRGARALSLAEAIDSGEELVERHLGRGADIDANPFVALNSGFVRDGAFVHLPRGAARVLTWGGLRGGISVAPALSVPAAGPRDTLLTLTYCVVVFSILVQGLTIARVIKRSLALAPAT